MPGSPTSSDEAVAVGTAVAGAPARRRRSLPLLARSTRGAVRRSSAEGAAAPAGPAPRRLRCRRRRRAGPAVAEGCQLEVRRREVVDGLADDHRARVGRGPGSGRRRWPRSRSPRSGGEPPRLGARHDRAARRGCRRGRRGRRRWRRRRRPRAADDLEAGLDGLDLVVLAGRRVPEVGDDAVALELLDVPVAAGDGRRDHLLVRGDRGEVVLRVELLAQRRRPDEVGEHDGEEAPALVGVARAPRSPARTASIPDAVGGRRDRRRAAARASSAASSQWARSRARCAASRIAQVSRSSRSSPAIARSVGGGAPGGGPTRERICRHVRRERLQHRRARTSRVANAQPPERLDIHERVPRACTRPSRCGRWRCARCRRTPRPAPPRSAKTGVAAS